MNKDEFMKILSELRKKPRNLQTSQEGVFTVRALLSSDIETFIGTFLNNFDAQKWASRIVNSPTRMDSSFELILTDISTSETLEIKTYR